MARRSRQRGFTLVELMMVVAIIALLAAFVFTVAARPYDANGEVIAEQLSQTYSFARTRAVSTRKVHRVEIYTSTEGEQIVKIEAAADTGMTYTGTDWGVIDVKRIPKSAILWSATPGAITTTGESPAQDDNLPYTVTFKPDGSATASTIYITDRAAAPRYYRVLVYHATGSSYAREQW